MKKKILLVLAIFAMAGGTALAADYLPKTKSEGGNVTVSGSEVYKNLYVGGGSVNINKNILGDLFAAGGSVNIADQVEKDLFAAGGNVNILGSIGEDARVAGGNISINAPIGGDLLAAGGTIIITGGEIGGDLWTAGGVVNLNSKVNGDAKIAGGEILIDSEILGDLEVRGEEKVTFGPSAVVLGKIKHYGQEEAVVNEGAQVSEIEFIRVAEKDLPEASNFIGVFIIWKLLAMFVAGLIILKLIPTLSASVVDFPAKKPWLNLAIGFTGVVAIPILAIILMITLIGVFAGILLLFWYIFALIASGIFTIMLIGGMVEKWFKKREEITLSWKSLIWGAIIGAILGLIPVIGWLITCIIFLMTFGGVLQTVKQNIIK